MNSEFSTTEDHPENQSDLHSQDNFAFVECSKSVPDVRFVDTQVKSEPFYDFNDVSDNFEAGIHNTEIKHEQEIKIEETIVKNELNGSTYDDSCAFIDATNSLTSEIKIKEEKSALENVGAKLSRKYYTCTVCDYETTSLYDLRMHIPKHRRTKEVRPYKCSMCQYAGLTMGKLEEHMKTHPQKIQSKCTLCEYATTNSMNFKFHMKAHTWERSHKCIICGFASTTLYHLRVHMITHTGRTSYKYYKYEYAGLTKGMVDEDMKTQPQVKHHMCTVCPYTTTNSIILKSHMKTHTGKIYNKYECTGLTKAMINGHMKTQPQVKHYRCSLCTYATTNSEILKSHMKTHTGDTEHMKTHPKEIVLKCTLCEYATVTSTKLMYHMEVHTERTHKCTICSYAAAKPYHLKRHMRTHPEWKPYECNKCRYAGVTKRMLNKHMKTHTQAKRYTCALCLYATTNSRMFKSHMKTHTEKIRIDEENFSTENVDEESTQK